MGAAHPSLRHRLTQGAVPLVIAHRGASAHAPENTAVAFRLALESKAELVELDYHHSADGVPVVIHDKTLDRTTNATALWGGEKLPVSGRTRAELETLDAGSWRDPAFAGTRLPTLEQALLQILPGAVPLIERKAGDAQTLVALLRRLDRIPDVVVQSFDWDFLAAVRARAPNLLLGALGSGPLDDAALDRCRSLGVFVVGWRAKDLRAESILAARARGLQVWAYTVDDEGLAEKLVEAGVTGIITNRPAEMRRALRGPR